MSKAYPKKILDILHSVGLRNNLRDKEVKEIYDSQFEFIFQEMRKLDLKNASEEELDKMKTNFQIKYLGKLFINKESLKDKKKWKKEI